MKATFLSAFLLFPFRAEVSAWSSPAKSGSSAVSRRDAIAFTLSVGSAQVLASSAFPTIANAEDANANANANAQTDYITTDRGIKYKVTAPPSDASSATPERAQKVKAKYTLYLNGFPEDTDKSTKIDSSKGLFGEKPFEFLAGVSQVIKGVSC